MNRKPQPADSWWPTHQNSCNGMFIKISGPAAKVISKVKDKDKPKIETGTMINNETANIKTGALSQSQLFQGKGRTWSESNSLKSSAEFKNIKKIPNFFAKNDSKIMLKCVNCSSYKTDSLKDLNEHLDICLLKVFINLAEDELELDV